MLKVLCPVEGKVIISKQIPDATFGQSMMGTTLGVIPNNGNFVAPISGELVISGGHAYCIQANDGSQVLVHIGIDTVKIPDKQKAKIFKYSVNQGDKVKAGQPIVVADLKAIKKCGYSITTPIVVIGESVEGKNVTYAGIDECKPMDELFHVE